MQKFEADIKFAQDSKSNMKKYLRTELTKGMQTVRQRQKMEKDSEAIMDEVNKPGPPFLLEMEDRQRQIETKTKELNDYKNRDNFIQMMLDKNRVLKRRAEEIQEFEKNYQDDF